MATGQHRVASVLVPLVLDTVLVLAFVLIGRTSHEEGLLGTFGTLWPFLGGLAIGWASLRAWRSPRRIVWTGVGIWVATVIGGLVLRMLGGEGVQPTFVIVTTVVLGVFLLGWRAISLLAERIRARPRADAHG